MNNESKSHKRWESWGKPLWAMILAVFVGWMADASMAERMILFFAIMCWFEILTHRHGPKPPPQ